MSDEIVAPLKRCTKCGEIKSLLDFYKDAKAKGGVSTKCKLCTRATVDIYREIHADAINERQRQRYRDNPTKNAERNRDYRTNHPEQMRTYRRKWRINNLPVINVLTQRRRARHHNLPDTFTDADWQRALDYFDNRCAYCNRQQGLWHILARDHYVPQSKDGGYTPDNIVPACHGVDGCNNSKHDSDPHEWLIKHFGARQAELIEGRIAAYFASLQPLE